MKWPKYELPKLVEVNPQRPRLLNLADDSPVTFVPMSAVSEITASIERPEIRNYADVKKGFTCFGNNDVLFAKITPCMENGKTAIARDLVNDIGFGSTEFHVLRANKVLLLPQYLHYFIRQQSFRNEAKARMQGAVGQQRVSKDYFRNIVFPLPPMSEQRRIVEILDHADALRKKRAEADAKAAHILPALFYKMFGDPATNPKGWPLKKLGDPQIALINPRFSDSNIPTDTEFSFVPMADIDEICGRIVGRQTRTHSEVMRGFTTFQDNDVLFAKITPCMQNGKAAIARNLINGRGFGSTEFHVLRAGHLSTPEWLYILIRLPWFKKQAESSFTGTVGQQRVPPDFLSNYTIGCPPIDLQNEFTTAVMKFQELVDQRELSAGKLENLFSCLLHRAFTGDLTAKWREAHMKELLAEMEIQSKLLATSKTTNKAKERIS